MYNNAFIEDKTTTELRSSMKKSLGLLLILLCVSLTVTPQLTTVKAQSKTIIVPDDYPSIASAIGAATNGDTILVRSGFYNETELYSDVSLSLIGEGASQTTISLHPPIYNNTIGDETLSGYDNPIEIDANNVVVSGFTITSTGGNIVINGNNEWVAGNILKVDVELNGNYETVTNNTLNLSLGSILITGSIANFAKTLESALSELRLALIIPFLLIG